MDFSQVIRTDISLVPDALVLAHIQFAAYMTFHILSPIIGLSLCDVKTRAAHSMGAFQFWMMIVSFTFTFTFTMGVINGIIMNFQFGKTWPGFMEKGLQPRQAIVGL